MGRRVPGVRRSSRGRTVRRRRRPRVRRPVPGGHRCHDGPRPPGGRRGARAAGPARHDHDAALQRCRLGGRGARPSLRPPVVAVRHDRHRRQPLRAALRADDHRPSEGGGHGLVLPRHRGRDPRRARRRPGGPAARRDGTAGRRRPHDPGGAVQRRGRPRRRARPRRRGVPADGARADQHRHRAARGGLPRRRPGGHPAPRRPARHRRDPHPVRRSRGRDPGVGSRPGPARGGQADRRWRAGGGVRHERGGGRPHRPLPARPRRRRGWGRRHADRQRPGPGRHPGHARQRPARRGLRGGRPARDPLHRGRGRGHRRAPGCPGTSSSSAAGRSTGSAPRPAPAPTPPRRSTTSSRSSCTCGPSTAGSC